MAVICPAILASDENQLHTQISKVAHFAHRLQIDLTDGHFAEHKTIQPDEVWWPAGVKADIHLMYNHPAAAAQKLLVHRPHLIIVHAEANGDFDLIAKACQHHSVKVGVALLPETSPEVIVPSLNKI